MALGAIVGASGRGAARPWHAAAVVALFLVFLELLKGGRSAQWSGLGAEAAFGLVVGALVYFAVLWAGVAAAAVVLRVATAGRLGRAARTGLGALAAGGGVWTALSMYRETAPTLDDGMVALALAAFACGLLARRIRGELDGAGWAALCAAVVLSGVAAFWWVSEAFLFNPNRSDAVTWLPSLWMGLHAAALAAASSWNTGRLRGLVAGCVAALFVVAPVAGGTVSIGGWPGRSAPTGPNIVLVVADTMRAGSLRLHGGPVAAPAIERLAAAGAHYAHSYALAPWTPPSMSGMMASTYPPGLAPGGTREDWLRQLWQYEVGPETTSLAEALHARGYATGAVLANVLLPVIPGMMRGIETRAVVHPILLRPAGLFQAMPFLHAALHAWLPHIAPVRPHDTSAALTRFAEAYLRRQDGQPFFLWVHYMDPHAPYDPPGRLRTRTGPWPFYYPYAGGERWGVPRLDQGETVPESARDYVRDLYEGEVRYADGCLARVVDVLEATGLRGNTYVCFTADHGEELWEHGAWGHGQSLYEELIHVPLVIAGPDVAAQEIAAPVSALDLAPTLAALAGVPAPPAWRGVSRAEELTGSARAGDGPIFVQGTSDRAHPWPLQSVVDWPLKLVRGHGGGPAALYDLEADPAETNDLAGRLPAETARLGALLDDWSGSFESTFPMEHADDGGAFREHLRALGYL